MLAAEGFKTLVLPSSTPVHRTLRVIHMSRVFLVVEPSKVIFLS